MTVVVREASCVHAGGACVLSLWGCEKCGVRRGITTTSRQERANRHPKGGEGGGHPSKGPNRRDTRTQHEQHNNTTRHDHHTTTHPPSQQHASQCTRHRTTVVVSRPVSWFLSVVFCLLSLFLSCPPCLVSVLTRVCLCVLMYTCSSHVSVSVRLFVCLSREKGQNQKHSVVAPLTCQSYVILTYRDERLNEPECSWFLPQFPYHRAVNRECVVLDLFSDMFSRASFFKTVFLTKIVSKT